MKPKKYQIIIQQGVQVLMADGKPQICPFQQATPLQDKFRGIQLVPAACTAQCPHFNIIPEYELRNIKMPVTVELTCGPMPSTPRIIHDETEENKPDNKSGIILN